MVFVALETLDAMGVLVVPKPSPIQFRSVSSHVAHLAIADSQGIAVPKRQLLHEWMHRFEGDFGVIRVWTQLKAEGAAAMSEFAHQHQELRDAIAVCMNSLDSAVAACDALAAIEFVNAVEQLDSAGNGRLVYVDWP